MTKAFNVQNRYFGKAFRLCSLSVSLKRSAYSDTNNNKLCEYEGLYLSSVKSQIKKDTLITAIITIQNIALQIQKCEYKNLHWYFVWLNIHTITRGVYRTELGGGEG